MLRRILFCKPALAEPEATGQRENLIFLLSPSLLPVRLCVCRQAIAFAADLNDVGMMQQAIEQGGLLRLIVGEVPAHCVNGRSRVSTTESRA